VRNEGMERLYAKVRRGLEEVAIALCKESSRYIGVRNLG